MEKKVIAKETTCFVIGPIGPITSDTRRNADFLLRGIIKPALSKMDNIKIWRADEDTFPGMITDKLINDIHDTDLVIADLSELNPNVSYELGIRHSTGKATIHIAEFGTKLPFDNLGHRTIFFDRTDWISIESTRENIYEQAKQTFIPDFTTTNPVIQALNSKAFHASALPKDKFFLELSDRLDRLERRAASPLPTVSSSDRAFLRKLIIDRYKGVNIECSQEQIEYTFNHVIKKGGDLILKKSLYSGDFIEIESIISEGLIPF